MSAVFTGITRQSSVARYNHYAATSPREPNDWNYTTRIEPSNKVAGVLVETKFYTGPDKAACSIGAGSHQEDPVLRAEFLDPTNPGSDPLIRCYYNANNVTREVQVFNWQAKVTPYDDLFNIDDEFTIMMNTFCSQVLNFPPPNSSLCYQPPSVLTVNRSCSRLRVLDPDSSGRTCRSWLNASAPDVRESVMQEIALHHPDLVETGCINRTRDPVYQGFAQAFTFPDGCWWIPCKDTANFLVPPSLEPGPGACPTNVCTQIISIGHGRDINLRDLQLTIDCNFTDSAIRTYECQETPLGNPPTVCVIANCDVLTDPNTCWENDMLCGGECSAAHTFRCFTGSCEPTICDLEEDALCFSDRTCNFSCVNDQTTYRYADGECFQSPCSPVDNITCFTDRTCGGLAPLPVGIGIGELIGILVGGGALVVLIIIISVFASRAAKKKALEEGRPLEAEAFEMPVAGVR